VPFPQDIHVAKLTHKGLLINPLSQQPVLMGHFDQPGALLPFPLRCCTLELLAPAELDRIAEAQLRAEEKGILDMLSALGLSLLASPAALYSANGHDQVNIRIRSGDTKDLPPTASKPDAVYNPRILYSNIVGVEPPPVAVAAPLI
jgi:hypothetical protein